MGGEEGESGQDWDISERDKLEKLPSFRTVNTYSLEKNGYFHSKTSCVLVYSEYNIFPLRVLCDKPS